MPRWLGEVVDLLLPGRCVGCGDWIPLGTGRGAAAGLVCGGCLSRLGPPPAPRCPRCDFPLGTGRPRPADDGGAPPPACLACRTWPDALVRSRTAVLLEPPADALVHALKYEGWRRLARPLGERMARAVPLLPTPDRSVVVPVPTTARRLRGRGYNQAGLLADVVAERLRLPLAPVLERRGDRGTQVALHPAERRANVARVFHVPGAAEGAVRGRHAVLVDDVLTTGATVAAAALALERAGAAGVTVVAFARSVPRRP